MASKERPWLRDLAHISTIVSTLVALGITGVLAVFLQALVGVAFGLSPFERVLLGICVFFIVLAIVLGGLNKYLQSRRSSAKSSDATSQASLADGDKQFREENKQLKTENKRLQSENEWLRTQIPQPDDEELVKRSRYWSGELLPFLENRAREEPQVGVFSAEVRHHHQETIAQYNQRFAGPVGALLNDLELRGWCSSKERRQFENPMMVLTIQQIANRLAAIGHRHK